MINAERWLRIEQLYHAALDREPGERGRFLAEACGKDTDLREEIESLLKQDLSGSSPLDSPAWENAESFLETTNHPRLQRGNHLGPYRIEAIIGAGGMGEVYKAHDHRLRRDVAIKVLRAEFSKDPERQRRFEREARAAALLNHPNIVAVYDVGAQEGILYVVSELLDGRTLRAALKGQPLPQQTVFRYALQIASGLRAAHQHGIVHRDLKPENIFITRDGTIKILDLGLAKLTGPMPGGTDPHPATDSLNTQPGILMGTAGYMSPEQVRGEAVDARSDIFAFGAILYEMASGRSPFRRDTFAESMHAILTESTAELPSSALDRIVRHCLEKDRTQRFQSAHDLVFALETLAEAPSAGSAPATSQSRRSRRSRLVWLVGGLAALVIAALAFAIRPRSPSSEPEPRVVPFTSYTGFQTQPAFSPDGNEIAFAWTGDHGSTTHIYAKVIGTDSPLRLTSGDKDDRSPAWAPEGRSIAFIRQVSDAVNAIYTVSPLGGRERRIVEIGGPEGPLAHSELATSAPRLSWSRDGKWLVTSGHPSSGARARIMAVSADTGEIRVLDFGGTVDEFGPALSPDSHTLAFCRWQGESGTDIYAAHLTGDLRPTGAPRRLDTSGRYSREPAWTPDGTELVFGYSPGDSTFTARLWRVLGSGTGPARPIEGIGEGAFYPAIAPHKNRLAFQHIFRHVNIWQIPIAGIQTPGRPEVLLASTRLDILRPNAFSPDGRKIAFESERSGPHGIWIANADGSAPIFLYGGPGYLSGSPVWSPDGQWIAFDSRKETHAQIYVISADGGAARRVTHGDVDDMVPFWSRDGKWIYFDSRRGERYEIFRIPPSGGTAIQITHNGGWAPQESADGQFIYYTRSRSAVSPLFRMAIAGGPEVQILPAVYPRGWTIGNRGIWYWQTTPTGDELQFIDLGSNERRAVARLGNLGPLALAMSGLALSPDQHTILYNRADRFGTEILLVENFR